MTLDKIMKRLLKRKKEIKEELIGLDMDMYSGRSEGSNISWELKERAKLLAQLKKIEEIERCVNNSSKEKTSSVKTMPRATNPENPFGLFSKPNTSGDTESGSLYPSPNAN